MSAAGNHSTGRPERPPTRFTAPYAAGGPNGGISKGIYKLPRTRINMTRVFVHLKINNEGLLGDQVVQMNKRDLK